MAVEIKREVTLGKGERGFQFDVRKDAKKDRQLYEIGRKLESSIDAAWFPLLRDKLITQK
jgi:hypothetical protein